MSHKAHDTVGGGGGGGDHDKLVAPKGKLPKFAMKQFTPPVIVARNDHPKLAMEPSVVVPPQVKMPSVASLNLGDRSRHCRQDRHRMEREWAEELVREWVEELAAAPGRELDRASAAGLAGGVFRVGGGVSARECW